MCCMLTTDCQCVHAYCVKGQVQQVERGDWRGDWERRGGGGGGGGGESR